MKLFYGKPRYITVKTASMLLNHFSDKNRTVKLHYHNMTFNLDAALSWPNRSMKTLQDGLNSCCRFYDQIIKKEQIK